MEIIRCRFIEKTSLGCELAPAEILAAFKEISYKEDGSLLNKEKIRYEEIHVNLDNREEAEYLMFENGKEAIERNFKVFFIGGDSNINYSLLKAYIEVEDKPLVIHLSAETGCGHEGNSWLRRLVEHVSGRHIVSVGTRNFSEKEFMKKNSLLSMNIHLLEEDLHSICDLLMERAHNSSSFFLTINGNVLDPAFAPGVNHLSPGGLSTRQLFYIIRRLMKLHNFKGAIISDINPAKDVNGMTVLVAAHLLAEMM